MSDDVLGNSPALSQSFRERGDARENQLSGTASTNPREIAFRAWQIRRNADALATMLETSSEINPVSFAAALREMARLAREIQDAVAEPGGGDQFANSIDASNDRWLTTKDIADHVGRCARTITRHAPKFCEKVDGQYRASLEQVELYWGPRIARRPHDRKERP